MKIVINRCFGGFGISEAGMAKLIEWGLPELDVRNIRYEFKYRNHPLLVKLVETYKNKSDTKFSDLAIVEIPDSVNWTIEEYDGREHVSEVHQTWGCQ